MRSRDCKSRDALSFFFVHLPFKFHTKVCCDKIAKSRLCEIYCDCESYGYFFFFWGLNWSPSPHSSEIRLWASGHRVSAWTRVDMCGLACLDGLAWIGADLCVCGRKSFNGRKCKNPTNSCAGANHFNSHKPTSLFTVHPHYHLPFTNRE